MSDESLAGFTAAVVTVSDSKARGESEDLSGPEARRVLESAGARIDESAIVADEERDIAKLLGTLVARPVDLIVTTGGTGVAPRDVTPDATLRVASKVIPGLAEVMRSVSLVKTPHAALSRAVAAVAGKTLIINLPGSPGGVRDCLSALLPVLPHAIHLLKEEPTGHRQS